MAYAASNIEQLRDQIEDMPRELAMLIEDCAGFSNSDKDGGHQDLEAWLHGKGLSLRLAEWRWFACLLLRVRAARIDKSPGGWEHRFQQGIVLILATTNRLHHANS